MSAGWGIASRLDGFTARISFGLKAAPHIHKFRTYEEWPKRAFVASYPEVAAGFCPFFLGRVDLSMPECGKAISLSGSTKEVAPL